MQTKRKRKFGLSILVITVIFAMAGSVASSVPRPAQAAGPTGLVCTTGPTFNLKAVSGYASFPDGNSVFMWSFAKNPGSFQLPSPVLCVNEGDTVTVNLTNNLPDPPGAVTAENTSIIFPGQSGVTTSGGVPGLFTAEAAPGGGTVSYSFVATEPGTYLYESGTNQHKQIHMGLYGVIVVRPAMGANFAYNDASTKFDPDREYLILMHDLDPSLHLAVERGKTYNVTLKHDRYWTINGRSFPDTVADNFAAWLPNQPYGAIAWIEPFDATNNPDPALVRMVNAGMANHPFHPHSNNMQIIARDGRLLDVAGVKAYYESFTTTIGSGQTYDLLFSWTNVEAWTSSGNPIPVELPLLQNLVFKDDVTFYSGSPYLGEQDTLPPLVTSFNQCGEFYFPWHSHALNEFQNFDEGFGGLATLVRVDPPGGCP
jgi:FtsP/CotA-like multicopper oxidase with cupredoxin domain